jgi:hypothetical protein
MSEHSKMSGSGTQRHEIWIQPNQNHTIIFNRFKFDILKNIIMQFRLFTAYFSNRISLV